MVTANKAITKPEDMKGMKLRVPPAPLYLMLTKSVGANATPIAFAEVYLALQQGTVDGQENPLPTIMAKKFYEVQTHVMLTGHITESLLTIVGSHVWAKLSDAEKKIFEEVLSRPPPRRPSRSATSEQKIAEELRKLGKTVVQVDREAFREAAVPLHNDGSGRLEQGRIRRAAGVEVSEPHGEERRVSDASRTMAAAHRAIIEIAGIGPAGRLRQDEDGAGRGQHERRKTSGRGTSHLIVEDEEVVIEHHPEDWIAFVIFWSLAFIVFLQFFTRYILNDSLAWTEEIARYGLMWIVFIGGIMVTRRNTPHRG